MKFITKIDPKRFNDFVNSHPKGHYRQLHEWGVFKASNSSWEFDTIGLENDNHELVATALVLIRFIPILKRPLLYIPRGMVIDYEDDKLLKEFIICLKRYAKQRRAVVVKIDPDITYRNHGSLLDEGNALISNDCFIDKLAALGFKHNGFTMDLEGFLPRFVYRLNLSDSQEVIQQRMHRKTRYNIKLAKKKGVEVVVGDRKDLPEFFSLMEKTGKRSQFLNRPFVFFESLYDVFASSGMLKLYLAKVSISTLIDYLEGELDKQSVNKNEYLEEIQRLKILKQNQSEIVLSASIIVYCGDYAWYLFGANDDVYRNFMSSYLIQWAAMSEAKDMGYKAYDFIGCSGVLKEGHPLYGVYRFKRGFGSDFKEFVGEFDMVIDRVLYPLWQFLLRRRKTYLNIMNLLHGRSAK